MNLLNELAAARAELAAARSAVEALTGPATEAREAASAATVEAVRLARVADDAAATARRNPGRQSAHAAEDAARPARAAEAEAQRLRIKAAALGEQHSAARSVLRTAEVEYHRLDARVHADDRAAAGRQEVVDAEQTVTAAQARITTLRDQIAANTATLALHRAALDAAVVANDRDAWMSAQFDVQVGERAIADDTAELQSIDVGALRTVAAEARVRAEKMEQTAELERVASSIDWSLVSRAVVLDPATRSVRLTVR